MRPNPLVTRSYLMRGALLWLGARGILACVFAWANLDPIRLSAAGIAEVIALTVAIGFFDVHRRRERALLGNLGIGFSSLAMLFMVPVILGELAGVALRWIG